MVPNVQQRNREVELRGGIGAIPARVPAQALQLAEGDATARYLIGEIEGLPARRNLDHVVIAHILRICLHPDSAALIEHIARFALRVALHARASLIIHRERHRANGGNGLLRVSERSVLPAIRPGIRANVDRDRDFRARGQIRLPRGDPIARNIIKLRDFQRIHISASSSARRELVRVHGERRQGAHPVLHLTVNARAIDGNFHRHIREESVQRQKLPVSRWLNGDRGCLLVAMDFAQLHVPGNFIGDGEPAALLCVIHIRLRRHKVEEIVVLPNRIIRLCG